MKREFPSSAVASISIETQRGSVRVVSKDGPVRVEVDVAKGSEDCDVSAELVGGELRVRARRRRRWLPRPWTCRASIVVTAPARAPVSVLVGAGEIAVSGRSGEVRALVLSGSLSAERMAGPLRARVGRGDVAGSGGTRLDVLTLFGRLRWRGLLGGARAAVAFGSADISWEDASPEPVTVLCAAGPVSLELPKGPRASLRLIHALGRETCRLSPEGAFPLALTVAVFAGGLRIDQCR